MTEPVAVGAVGAGATGRAAAGGFVSNGGTALDAGDGGGFTGSDGTFHSNGGQSAFGGNGGMGHQDITGGGGGGFYPGDNGGTPNPGTGGGGGGGGGGAFGPIGGGGGGFGAGGAAFLGKWWRRRSGRWWWGTRYSGGSGGFGGGGGGSGSGGGSGGFGGGGGAFYTHQKSLGGQGLGGAIFNHTGTLMLVRTTASNNSAHGGLDGDTFLVGFNGSRATGAGGVVYNLNGTVTIQDSTIGGAAENTADLGNSIYQMSANSGRTASSQTPAAFLTLLNTNTVGEVVINQTDGTAGWFVHGGTLQLGSNTAPDITFSATIAGDNGAGVTKIGTDTVILIGTNTYPGQTKINAGTLRVPSLASGGSPSTRSASPPMTPITYISTAALWITRARQGVATAARLLIPEMAGRSRFLTRAARLL